MIVVPVKYKRNDGSYETMYLPEAINKTISYSLFTANDCVDSKYSIYDIENSMLHSAALNLIRVSRVLDRSLAMSMVKNGYVEGERLLERRTVINNAFNRSIDWSWKRVLERLGYTIADLIQHIETLRFLLVIEETFINFSNHDYAGESKLFNKFLINSAKEHFAKETTKLELHVANNQVNGYNLFHQFEKPHSNFSTLGYDFILTK